MKLLFVHDHPFYKENDDIYTGGSFPFELWENYLINFTEISVFAREANNEKSKVARTSGDDRVSFFLTKNYNSPLDFVLKRKVIEAELISLINSVDVVLVRLPSVLGILAGELAIKMNKKIWVEQVGNGKEALMNHGSLLGKLAASIFHIKNKNVVKEANFVSYVTKSKLQKDYPCSNKCISVALSDVIIPEIVTVNDVFYKRFTSKELKIGLLGGFDTNYKGQRFLLKAIALLEKNIKENIELYFAGKGDGDWIYELSEQLGIKENIKFVGALKPGKEVNEFLEKLNLYVQPSLTEGMPRSVVEAMAMGCPVLGSDVGGIPDLIDTKYLHKKGDYLLLSKQIENMFKDRNALVESALLNLRTSNDFTIDKLDKARTDFYSNMNKSIL